MNLCKCYLFIFILYWRSNYYCGGGFLFHVP